MTWPPELPFAAVLARASVYDQAALSMLYRRFLPVVYRFALARIGNVHVAEDITADTFFAMIEGIAKTRAHDELDFAAWLLGIARNQVALYFRRKRTRGETPFDQTAQPEWAQPQTAAEESDPLAILTARERWHEIAVALDRLTEEQRTVVLYRCVLDYSAEEVGALLGKKPGAVRVLQFRALASLARYLGLSVPETSLAQQQQQQQREEKRLGRKR